jgi:hypothetical protein
MMKSLFIRSLVVLGAVISITFAMSTAALAETKSVGQTTFPDLTGAVMVVNNNVPKKPDEIYALLPDGNIISLHLSKHLTQRQRDQLEVFFYCGKERIKFNADATIGNMILENGNEFASYEKVCLTTAQLEKLNHSLLTVLTTSAQKIVQDAAVKAYDAGYAYGINNPIAARPLPQPTPSIHCTVSPNFGLKGETDVNCY